jgi:subtilisin family serine protease
MYYFRISGPLNVTAAITPSPVYDELQLRTTHLSLTPGALHRKEHAVRRNTPVLFLLIMVITVLGSAPSVDSVEDPPQSAAAAARGKMNAQMRFQRDMRTAPMKTADPARAMLGATGGDKAIATVKFDHVLSGSEIADLESRGIEFFRMEGEIARTRAIYPVKIPWNEIDGLGARREVLRLESSWKPAIYPALDVSVPEIGADSAWTHDDPLGFPITGKGLRVADFDTGVDVFHPSFFYADGDTFNWIDLNENGVFDHSYDFVDLNNNGEFDFGETLRLEDGLIMDYAGVWCSFPPANTDNVYQTYWDWIYADLNYNFNRDFGPAAGFTESSPGFGEPTFVALDDDGDGELDVGERLVQLGSSKIYATMNAGSIERMRGTDLMLSDDDTNGHGTAVMGVVGGGTRGYHRFCGIAPDAELLAGYFFSGVPISYLIPWARSHGADVMLYEFGGFVWEFLDGSTLDEETISIENETIIQITPSGNLGRGGKHAITDIPSGGNRTLIIVVPTYGGNSIRFLYGSTLWLGGLYDLTFSLRTPIGTQIVLAGGWQLVDNYAVWIDFDTSVRGTNKMDLYVDHDGNADAMGTWELTVANGSGASVEIISNIADDLSSWADGAEFTNYNSNDRNVTFPATCDSAFCNGSYSTRGFEGYGGTGGGSIPIGEISAFSGRGERIDGKHLLDIVSPGNYDVYTTMSHTTASGYPNGSYRQFSGTSAAGPHVAAAAALVQQAWPAATMPEIELLLASHALEDGFTGTVYNDTWGYGKLRILGAIGVAAGVEDMADGRLAPRLLLDQNYPNPFNPVTWIPFYLPGNGHTTIRIYDVRGALVRTLRKKWMSEGAHSVTWDGNAGSGLAAVSGIYFCVLEQDGGKQTRKMVLLR